jgi:hypothetical protein
MAKQAKQSKQTTPITPTTPTVDLTTENNTIVEDNVSVKTAIAEQPNTEPEKKKRGRKKNVIVQQISNSMTESNGSVENLTINPEKKIRKRRSKKEKSDDDAKKKSESMVVDNIGGEDSGDINVPLIKKRKRRTCKNKNKDNNGNGCENVIIDNGININGSTDSNMQTNTQSQPEEKVIKKRGRKPKGGKITTHQLEDNNVNNEMPNIILHLKCSLSNIKNSTDDEYTIQSYNSTKFNGSEISVKKILIEHEQEKKNANNISDNNIISVNDVNNVNNTIKSSTLSGESIRPFNEVLNNNASSSLFQVYDPVIPMIPVPKTGEQTNSNNFFTNLNETTPYTKTSTNHTFLNNVYSSDINSYSNDYDDGDDSSGSSKNEREIWKKINQLKLSFHKSDICNNMGGTQRSACFWCTCEFDSPAIYIPKSLSKDVYNVYGCFCSPECAAAFLMNENIDTSTRFERYHLLNSLYGKIYKYEKSIKIAPNPFYLLNKYYGNLTIQEYRKLFQSDQMIYVVNKPLTHILPELYEDNNDFLLNSKIIPTNTVNIKKNKPLKSNILNSAFGIN